MRDMDAPRPRPIRVKAMLVVPNDDFSAHAVALYPPTDENPLGYHRFMGGSLELGEPHAEAVRREAREELGAELTTLRLAEVIESIYTLNGRLDHEIVFMYVGRPDPMPGRDGSSIMEPDGQQFPLVWRPVDDTDESLPLYPDGAADLVRKLAATT